MDKSHKYVDPTDSLYVPPVQKTKLEAFRSFVYDGDEGSCLGRTPKEWIRVLVFYIIFYLWLAAFWAACMWGLLQCVDIHTPTYILDSSIIGTSPGLSSRPLAPEGHDSVLIYFRGNRSWASLPDYLPSVDQLLQEYQTTANNSEKCGYMLKRNDENVVCEVDVRDWNDCKPNGTSVHHICIFFKINKVFEWKPDYYKDVASLPQEMPVDLKNEINETFTRFPEKKNKVWISCEGRHEADVTNLGDVSYFPEQGFPGYYFPFRNQDGFRSPVVAMRIHNPKADVVIQMECRTWAHNIIQDRKEQIAVLNFKIKIE